MKAPLAASECLKTLAAAARNEKTGSHVGRKQRNCTVWREKCQNVLAYSMVRTAGEGLKERPGKIPLAPSSAQIHGLARG